MDKRKFPKVRVGAGTPRYKIEQLEQVLQHKNRQLAKLQKTNQVLTEREQVKSLLTWYHRETNEPLLLPKFQLQRRKVPACTRRCCCCCRFPLPCPATQVVAHCINQQVDLLQVLGQLAFSLPQPNDAAYEAKATAAVKALLKDMEVAQVGS
jgi:hypothetical protein